MGLDVPRIRIALVPLLLLGLNLLGGNLGPLSPATYRALALSLLVIAWCISAASVARIAPRGLLNSTALLSAAISALMIMASDERALWIGGLCLNAYGLSRLLGDRAGASADASAVPGRSSRAAQKSVLTQYSGVEQLSAAPNLEAALSARAVAHAAAFYLIAFLLLRHVPLAWNAIHAAATAVSGELGRLLHTGLVQGPSTGGVFIFASVLAYLIAREAAGPVRQGLVLALAAAVQTCLFLIQLGAGPWIAVQIARPWAMGLAAHPQSGFGMSIDHALAAMYSPLLLMIASTVLVLLVEPLWIGGRAPTTRGKGAFRTRGLFGAGAVAFAAGAAMVWGQHFGGSTKGSSRILFYRDAKDTLRRFDVPGFQFFGTANAGMFGLLPRYLSAWGYESAHMEPENTGVTASRLEGCAALVVINPDRPFPKAELDVIWKYVEAGGSLLVLGDHTAIGGSMQPLNDLLAPADIRFNFDSAFTATHWFNVIDPLPHPITPGLDHANHRLQHSTGASLSIGPRVRPVVSARWAFSDAGDWANKDNAYLGDYAYQLTEPLSDLVIIAEAAYGAGKVLVFGDTSAFQNGGLPHSHAFIARVFGHLTRGRAPRAWWGFVGAGLLIGVSLLSLRGVERLGLRPVPILAVLPGLALVAAWPRWGAQPVEPPRSNGPLAVVDAAHVNRFSLGFWKDDSINGWLLNLSRNGYLPMVVSDRGRLEQLRDAELLAVIAPAEAYTEQEVRAVRDFIERGGLLVLSVGYQEKAASKGLLELTGFDIGETPLGPVPIEPPRPSTEALAAIMKAPHFQKAWPLVSTRSGPVEVFYREGIYDIMAFRRIGNGGALVIADPCFLHDKTLEAEKAWWPGNIELIRKVLTALRGRNPETQPAGGPHA